MYIKQVLQSRTNPAFVSWKGGAVSEALYAISVKQLSSIISVASLVNRSSSLINHPVYFSSSFLLKHPDSSMHILFVTDSRNPRPWPGCLVAQGGLDSQRNSHRKWEKVQRLLLSSSAGNVLH